MKEDPPRGRRLPLRVIGASLALSAAIAVVPALAATTAAHAAPAAATPSVVLVFGSATVQVGAQPKVTFAGANLPPRTVLYLQRGTAGGTGWRNVARSAGVSGTAKIPADQAGSYDYRLVAVDGRQAVAVSADAQLTVTGAPDSCTACQASPDALPWLKPIAAAVADWGIDKALELLLDFVEF